jgi:hypothetical protein
MVGAETDVDAGAGPWAVDEHATRRPHSDASKNRERAMGLDPSSK